MKIHELKTDPDQFQAVVDGVKKAEFRKDDKGFESGDVLHLREYDRTEIASQKYTGREALVEITWIVSGGEYGIPKDYCMMSFNFLLAQ